MFHIPHLPRKKLQQSIWKHHSPCTVPCGAAIHDVSHRQAGTNAFSHQAGAFQPQKSRRDVERATEMWEMWGLCHEKKLEPCPIHFDGMTIMLGFHIGWDKSLPLASK